jgi:hypothetical protein
MAELRETVIEPDACPFCGHILDRVTAGPQNPGATPEPGDVTICIQCGGLLIMDERVRVRPPTREEQAQVMTDPGVVRLIEAIANVHKGGPHGNDA